MKKITGFFVLLLFCLLAAGLLICAHAADTSAEGYRVSVFETSDIHGYIADTSSEDYQYRLAWIADKVGDARRNRDGGVILLDGGDIYQGNTLSNLLEGNPLSAAFALMEYDAVTIGNHEFDWGIENMIDPDGTMMDCTVNGEAAVNSVPVVLSNLYRNGEKTDFTRDYVILEKTAVNGDGETVPVRIGVVGFAEDYASSIMYSQFAGAGYRLIEDYAALEALAAELESSGRCDATILLTHTDAVEISGLIGPDAVFDLILGGHTHKNETGRTDRGLVYAEPACYGSAYAYAELVFSLDGEGKPVFEKADSVGTVSVTGDPAALVRRPENAEELDEAVAAVTDEAIAKIRDVLQEKIGCITVSALKTKYVSGARVIARESTCGNWMASLYARAVGAEIGFVNGGGVRENFIVEDGETSRDFTVSDVYALFPFNNEIYCYEITYDELLTLLRYSLTYAGGGLVSIVTGIDVYFTDYEVTALVKDGTVLYADGEWRIDPDEKVTIATNSYVATTERMSDKATGNQHNPLCVWNDTERLLSDTVVDSESALRLLKEEAAANGGYLYIDTKTHYIEYKAGEPVTPADLLLTMAPDKTVYTAGESFDPAGMILTVVRSDGTVADAADFAVDPAGPLEAGIERVEVTYTEEGISLRLEIPVTVTALAPAPEDPESRTHPRTPITSVTNPVQPADPVTPVIPVTPRETDEPDSALPFTDVDPRDEICEIVRYVYENGIMKGVPDTRFDLNSSLTRGMLVTILYRMEGSPEVSYSGAFSDVPAGEWYTDGVEWAAASGIVLGYDDGKYGPNDPVTREQLAAVLYRYARWKGYDTSVGEDTNILSYDDAFDIAEWAMPAMQWACGAGVLDSGTAAAIRPGEAAARGEIAEAIYVFMKTLVK